MMMIKKMIHTSKIKLLGTIFISLVIYFCLISLDWLAKVYLNTNKLKPNLEAELIEKKHSKTIAAKTKKKRDQGYKPMFRPIFFSKTSEYNSLYKKYATLPFGVKPNTKYYNCDEGYGLTTFESDKYGFWNPNKVYDKKIDIMIIGDSISANGCLQEEKSFIGMLRKDYNVMNLSIGSNDPIHYASLAQTFIPHFNPKIVLVIFNRGDFIDHYSQKIHVYEEVFFKQKIPYFKIKRKDSYYPEGYQNNLIKLLDDAQLLTEENIGNFDNLNPLQKPTILKRVLLVLSSHYNLTYLKNILFNQGYLPYGNELALKSLSENCKKNNCIGLYAFIPGSNYWRPDSRQNNYIKLLNKANKKFQDLNFINFAQNLDRSDIKFYSPKGNHLSVLGNKIIYSELILNIKEIGF